MDTEKQSKNSLDFDIQQSKADILRFLQQAAQGSTAKSPNKDIEDTKTPNITHLISDDELFAVNLTAMENAPALEAEIEPAAGTTRLSLLEEELIKKDLEIRNLKSNLTVLEEQHAGQQHQAQTLAEQLRQNQGRLAAAESELNQLKQTTEDRRLADENRKSEQALLEEQHRQDMAGVERQIAELEQINKELASEKLALADDLAASREAIASGQHLTTTLQQQLDAALAEKNSLFGRMNELNTLTQSQRDDLEKSRQHIESLRIENQASSGLIRAFENDIDSLQQSLEQEKQAVADLAQSYDDKIASLQKQVEQDKRNAEQICQQLRLRIAELDDQIAEHDHIACGKTREMEHLIAEQKSLLDKIEDQRRAMENRVASIQAENDRLMAAANESLSLREPLDKAQQQLEAAHHKLERLKGDHQLVGEENNQLHQMLHLRNQELEKLTEENKTFKEEIAELKTELEKQSILPVEPAEDYRSTSHIEIAREETVATESSEPKTAIPDFNLAEQIMAEQRRVIGAQRQSPGGRDVPARPDAVSRVVEQFVTASGKTELSQQPAALTATELSAWAETPISHDASEELFAEIVRQDILAFLEQKKKAFQQPGWSWNKIN